MKATLSHIILLLASFMLMLAGCSSDSPEAPSEVGDGPVDLVIRVAVNTPDASQPRDVTRASEYPAGEYPDGYEYGFEDPATIYENIHSLRVIIVRKNGEGKHVVEHNRKHVYPNSVTGIEADNRDFVFPVILGDDDTANSENKRIYLIANEESLQNSAILDILNGYEFNPSDAEAIITYNDWGTSKYALPYIDNESSTSEKRYVPMTEFFDIEVKRNQNAANGVTEQRETLFITRNLVKYQFEVNVEDKGTGVATNLKNLGNFRVKNIVFSNLMQKEYLFPHQTVYQPTKYPINANVNRIIKSFVTPGKDENQIKPYRFEPRELGFNGTDGEGKYKDGPYKNTYTPYLYFCETENPDQNNKYYIDVDVEMEDGEVISYKKIEMPNLPSLPRNTLVRIILNFKAAVVDGQVDLVPYIGIKLTPGFGFDQLLPGDHNKPSDW